jgi:hypothetical protein
MCDPQITNVWCFNFTPPYVFMALCGNKHRGHFLLSSEQRGAYRILVGRPEGKRPLGRPMHRLEDNIKIHFQELGLGGMDWIDLSRGRDRWRAVVFAVMNVLVP